jgi:hypothetical protein
MNPFTLFAALALGGVEMVELYARTLDLMFAYTHQTGLQR